MKKVEEYRARADECRSMASRSRLPRDKTMLMNMAATWESFAVTEQEHIDRQKGMAAPGIAV